jgi:origin recognition complex subunit 3
LEKEDPARVLVTICASEAPNLKTLLKHLIRAVTGENEDGRRAAEEKLLDYDLQAVRQSMDESEKNMLVIGIADSEAFQAHILAEFVDLIRYVECYTA